MVRRRAATLLLALALGGCSAAAAPDAPPESARVRPTIISLNPCTDAILAEVADPAQILAISYYSQDAAASSMDLAAAARFRAVSGSVEEVLALQPDLVIDGNYTSPAAVAAYRRLGFRLEQVPIARSLDQSLAQVHHLAALAGHPERGEQLVRRIEAAVQRAAPPRGAPVEALVWQAGGMVPGQDTLIADLLGRTGFTSAAALRGLQQADLLPLEQVLVRPPTVILAAGNRHAQEDRMLRHPALDALAATRRVPLDPALLWCGGPTIIRAADRLGAIRRELARGNSAR